MHIHEAVVFLLDEHRGMNIWALDIVKTQNLNSITISNIINKKLSHKNGSILAQDHENMIHKKIGFYSDKVHEEFLLCLLRNHPYIVYHLSFYSPILQEYINSNIHGFNI